MRGWRGVAPYGTAVSGKILDRVISTRVTVRERRIYFFGKVSSQVDPVVLFQKISKSGNVRYKTQWARVQMLCVQ